MSEQNDITHRLSEDSQVLTVTISKNYRRKEPWGNQLQDLSKLPKLKDLRIENEGTTTVRDFEGVFQAVEHNISLTQISFKDQGLGPKKTFMDSYSPLGWGFGGFFSNSTVKSLSLENLALNNCIQPITDALCHNETLQSLMIKDNSLTKQDLRILYEALMVNKSLVHLTLPSHLSAEPDYIRAMSCVAENKYLKELVRKNKQSQKQSIDSVSEQTLNAQKIQQLTNECEQFKQENNALKTEISQLKQEIEELKQAKLLLSDTNEQLQNRNRSLERNVNMRNNFEEEYKALKQEIEDLKRDLAHGTSVDIPHQEITLGDPIGAGTFGEVYKALWHGQNIAVKRIKLSTLGLSSFEDLMHESRTVMRLHHKHIVLSMGTTRRHDTEELMLVMEYMKHGSLHSLLFPSVGKSVKLERHQIIQLALDVAKGLNYLHCLTPKIIHRDLKCENILLYHNKTRAKISDFGTARFLNKNSVARTIHGTLGYVAPEVLEEQDYDEKADVFSFGMVLLVLATSCANLPTMRDATRLRNRINEILATNLDDDDGLKRLIIDCCQVSPAERPSVKQCIEVLKALRQKDTNTIKI